MAGNITNQQVNIPDYRKPAERRTEVAGYRVYRDQSEKLTREYNGRASEIVRALLDKFFAGEVKI